MNTVEGQTKAAAKQQSQQQQTGMMASAMGCQTGTGTGQGGHRNLGIKAGGDTYEKERLETGTGKAHSKEDHKRWSDSVDKMTMTASVVNAVRLVPQSVGSKGTPKLDAVRLVPQSGGSKGNHIQDFSVVGNGDRTVPTSSVSTMTASVVDAVSLVPQSGGSEGTPRLDAVRLVPQSGGSKGTTIPFLHDNNGSMDPATWRTLQEYYGEDAMRWTGGRMTRILKAEGKEPSTQITRPQKAINTLAGNNGTNQVPRAASLRTDEFTTDDYKAYCARQKIKNDKARSTEKKKNRRGAKRKELRCAVRLQAIARGYITRSRQQEIHGTTTTVPLVTPEERAAYHEQSQLTLAKEKKRRKQHNKRKLRSAKDHLGLSGLYALTRLQALARGVITRRSLRARFGIRFRAWDRWLVLDFFLVRIKRRSKAIDGQQWRQEQALQQRLRGTEVFETTWHAAPQKEKVTFTMTQTVYYTEGHCQIVYGTQPALSGKEWRIKSFQPKPNWHREQRRSLQAGHRRLEQRRREYFESFRVREEERRQQMERHRQLKIERKRLAPHHGMAKCRQPTNQHHNFQRHTQESTSTILPATLQVQPRDQVIFIAPSTTQTELSEGEVYSHLPRITTSVSHKANHHDTFRIQVSNQRESIKYYMDPRWRHKFQLPPFLHPSLPLSTSSMA
jgi:hypothetical protein